MCSFRAPSGLQSVPRSPPVAVPSAAVLAQMSDALPWPLLLVRRDAVLVHANLAARQLLHRGEPLVLTADRRVQPPAAAPQADFAAALRANGPVRLQWPASAPVQRALTARGSCSVMCKPLAAADATDSAPVLVMLATDTTRLADLHTFARLHGLSTAESRVLEQLSLGRSAAETAAALGRRRATVRGQVTRLLRKSGHTSVAGMLHALNLMPPSATLHLVQPPRDRLGE